MKKILIILFAIGLVYSKKSELNYYKELSENVDLFFNTYQQLNNRYVDSIDAEGFIKSGIDGMLKTLDPYTILLEGSSKRHYDDLTKGKYGGIGIYIGTSGDDKRLTVVSPIDDTPASKVGLKAGDRIMFINDMDTKGLDSRDASKYLRGDKGSKVILKIERSGEKDLLPFEIVRDIIKINNVPYADIVKGVGYIKVSQFSNGTASDVKKSVEDLLDRGAKGIVLDLRFNPGGLLSAAVDMSNIFLDKGVSIVSTKGKNGKLIMDYKTRRLPISTEIPLVVMINRSSASASEIVSGAIQDYDRGVIVGEGSFGKGLVQQIYPVNDSLSLKVTIAKYYTPTGRLIQKLDYFTENSIPQESDHAKYRTTNGREVLSGEGIVPDIVIDSKKYSNYIAYLRMKNIFSDFTYNLYKDQPDYQFSGTIDESLTDQFRSFISDVESEFSYNYTPMVDSLKSVVGDDEIISKLDEISQMLQNKKSNEFNNNLEDIKRLLDIDLTVHTKGNSSKYGIMLKDDPQFDIAVEIINDKVRYNEILNRSE